MYTLNMSTGVVTRDSDGAQVAPTQRTDDPLFVQYNNWINIGNSPVEYIPPIAVVSSTKLTVLGFRNRFTQAEKITMDMASIDNPTATIQQRTLAASLRVTNADLNVATFVDISRPDTRSGVMSLEQYGIIAANRALQILDTPIQEIEMYQL